MNEKTEILLQETNKETDTLSVSGNDALIAVSGNDIMLLSSGDDVATLSDTNMLLSAILFFMVASWCVDKIKSGVRRLIKYE